MLNPNDVGSIDLEPGQELTTATGKAEVLLTPGVYLRVDSNSAVKIVSPDLAQTSVEVDKGRAGVEVDYIQKENDLEIADRDVNTRLLQKGYYEFNANHPEVRVFSGKAAVEVADGETRDVKAHHELMLASDANGKPLAKEKPEGFSIAQAVNRTGYTTGASCGARTWRKTPAPNMPMKAIRDGSGSRDGGIGFFGDGFYSPFWGMGWGWALGPGWADWLLRRRILRRPLFPRPLPRTA